MKHFNKGSVKWINRNGEISNHIATENSVDGASKTDSARFVSGH